MSRRISKILLTGAGVLGATLAAHSAWAADNYPNRPVQIIVPYAAGGGVDIAARLLAAQLSEMTKQSFVVENKAGASGIVGSQAVSAAKTDGYTLLYAASTQAIFPYLPEGGSHYDVERELTPITQVVSSPFMVVVNPKLPINTPKELADYAKKNPGKFRWGLGGIGSSDHFAIAQFNAQAGIQTLTVPYKGGGPAAIATVSGEVDGIMDPPSLLKQYTSSGQLRALAVTSAEETPVVPGLPTVASFGFPGYEAQTWYGMWGPKQMPKETAAAVQQLVAKALADPALKQKLLGVGLAATGSSPDKFAGFFKSEIDKYGQLIKENNIHME